MRLQARVDASAFRAPPDAREVRPSPDGRQLVFAYGNFPRSRVAVSNVDGTQMRDMSDAQRGAFNPTWSPDGQRVAFTTLDSAFRAQVAIVDTDGKNYRVVASLDTAEGFAQWPAWSPDGKRLAVQAGKYNREKPAENTGHIWIVDVDSGKATKLGAHDRSYLDETPSWFPDGKRIAFQSDRTGVMHVWVMNADGTGAYQVTSWSP